MSDQCAHCVARGDIEACNATPCFHHETWYTSTIQSQLDDYQESHRSTQALVRQLDVLWNGEDGAARQASLCDIVSQIEVEFPRLRAQVIEEVRAEFGQLPQVHPETGEVCKPDEGDEPGMVFATEVLAMLDRLAAPGQKGGERC